MVKTNELRIGNWVDTTTAGLNDGIQVSGIYEGKICFDDGDMFDPKYVEPIPLTPEILEKCGFVKRQENEDGIIYGITNFTIIYGLTSEGTYSYFLNGYHNDAECKHLHQLQNLYFALTGEELNINLA